MPNDSLIPNRPEYYVQVGSMFDNPHGVPKAEIVSMLMELPTEVAAQVIFGRYVESSGLVFTAELIQNLFDRSLGRVTGERWFDEHHVDQAKAWRRREQSDQRFLGARTRSYFTGIDFARQTDYTVIFTIFAPQIDDPGSSRVVYFRRVNRVPWESIYREVGRCMAVFGSNVLGDASGPGGDVIFEALQDRMYCWKHDLTYMGNTQDPCPGDGCNTDHHVYLGAADPFHFTSNSKKELIENLRNVLAWGYRSQSDSTFGLLRSPPIVALEEELSFYTWDDKRLQTDCVMSLALASWIAFRDRVGAAHIGSPFGM